MLNNQVTASYPVRGALSSLEAITYARVDPGKRPAIFRRLRDAGLSGKPAKAPVAELVDALDSKSSSARSAGSIPARGTIRLHDNPEDRQAKQDEGEPQSKARRHIAAR